MCEKCKEAMKHLKNMLNMAGLVSRSMVEFNEKEEETLKLLKNYREAVEFLSSNKEDKSK